jgi:hypothetical protein
MELMTMFKKPVDQGSEGNNTASVPRPFPYIPPRRSSFSSSSSPIPPSRLSESGQSTVEKSTSLDLSAQRKNAEEITSPATQESKPFVPVLAFNRIIYDRQDTGEIIQDPDSIQRSPKIFSPKKKPVLTDKDRSSLQEKEEEATKASSFSPS